MSVSFLALSFTDPKGTGAELAQVLAQRPDARPRAVIVLRDGRAAIRSAFRIPAPQAGATEVYAFAQRLVSWCADRAVPISLALAPVGPNLPLGGALALELEVGPGAAAAEHLGAVVREFIEQGQESVGVLAVLEPRASAPVLDRLFRRSLAPLPQNAPPAWACAVHLVAGVSEPVANAPRITLWRQ